jgi:N-methylhydantoinase B
MSNVMNTPAEVIEKSYPIRIEQQSLRRGSSGAGRNRGGDGQVRVYYILAPEMHLTTMVDRCIVPPYGLQGGEAGEPFRITLIRASDEETILAGKTHVILEKDDWIVMETSGGGSYGQPS